jgi:hypothetical protein
LLPVPGYTHYETYLTLNLTHIKGAWILLMQHVLTGMTGIVDSLVIFYNAMFHCFIYSIRRHASKKFTVHKLFEILHTIYFNNTMIELFNE